jgi:two-component system CheB/CheR fusion protein
MSPTEPIDEQPDEVEETLLEEAESDQPPLLSDYEPLVSDDEPSIAVVGIGASAGGLAALSRLLQHAPTDSGLAWVVVTHLSPSHESHLALLLQAHTTMPVQ